MIEDQAQTNFWLRENGDRANLAEEYAESILSTYVRGDRTRLLILTNLVEISLGRDTQVFEWLRRYDKDEREWLLSHLLKELRK
tara:strand:+ start:400 stop:651 length:252 start_codon:yes stop_codon:yes gene_type:complete